jgi:beta-lactamase class A
VKFIRSLQGAVFCVFFLGVAVACGDDIGPTDGTPHDGALALKPTSPFVYPAPLWAFKDESLQRSLEAAISDLNLETYTSRKRLSVALADITDVDRPRVADINGDVMMYAASLPKIAVLLTAFEQISQGKLKMDPRLELMLESMIRRSSNSATTEVMHRVGKPNIANVLRDPRYRLYDPKHGGGLWVGKDYGKEGLWQRDPLHNISHGATAMQTARFYYLLQTGQLVNPEYSRKMKDILAETAIEHKFVKALREVSPDAVMCRKSGSWRNFHSDSALVEHDGKAYIAVALSEGDDGAEWLGRIIVALDRIIVGQSS